jgi:peptidoglycan/LPS O-acetylase OafA/YrhL
VIHRENNFDFIRFLAASLVLFSHSYALTGMGGAEPLVQLTNGRYGFGVLSVRVFFVLSGFLVCQSWIRRPQVVPFVVARSLRVLPGFAAALAYAVLVGLFVSRLSPEAYITHPETWRYFWHNLTMRTEFFLPGVFDDNIYPRAVNGSIWSLRYEVHAYAVLLGLGFLTLLRPRLGGVLAWAAAAATIWLVPSLWGMAAGRYAPVMHMCICFVMGALVALNPVVIRHLGWVTIALAATLPFVAGGGLDYHVNALLCAFFLWFAHRPVPVLRSWARFGDFSYGIFIYAFPTQQLIALHHATDQRPLLMTLLAFPATLALSVLSWHLVEGPCQAMKRRLSDALQRQVDGAHQWLAAQTRRGRPAAFSGPGATAPSCDGSPRSGSPPPRSPAASAAKD